ncbi:alpha/beta fold hydrolase [Palleronia caenipelagi]|uniref:Alpha/beta fold hydrolase n=1 Tax=Palleronia caenipelagi TaxID=2489174 RepID=A0A547PNK4_9RHOB|nr:alpha/beta fold hydrolase [Palleronia caenipelagi]TRD15726.1 alpha/beta fold hydrolase [Palleronia caenipelagi]
MPFRDHRLDVAGRRVTYVDEGPRDTGQPPLICLHGAAFDHAELTWRLTTAALRDQRRIIVPDLPGYGQSADLEGPAGLDAMGAWVLDFLDALDLEQVDLAGLSMGGGMALWVTIHAPNRVRKLIPVCPYGLMSRVPAHLLSYMAVRAGFLALTYRAAANSAQMARLGLARSYGDPARVSAKAVSELRLTAEDQAERRTFDRFLEVEMRAGGLRSDLTPQLGGITVPTLLIGGSADRLVPARHVRKAGKLIPDARCVILPTGHWPMRERPDLFNPLVSRFLAA